MDNWKTINGFDDYKVSDTGKVRSIERYIKSKSQGKEIEYLSKGRILKQQANYKNGYVTVVLRKNNKSYRKYVSILVANNFIPNPDNKPQVNHIDGNKTNNHISNLEWVTQKENNRHAWDTGLVIKNRDSKGKFKKEVK